MKKVFYINDKNHLELDATIASDFTVALDEFGSAIAYSSDLLLVFYDEIGVEEFELTGKSFRYLIAGFFVLDGQLFYLLDKLGPLNDQEITGHNEWFVWDKDHVYYLNGPVPGADPATFKYLGRFWAQDQNTCYFQNGQIAEADSSSFRVIDEHLAVDAKQVYGFLGKVVAPYSADPTPLGRGYYLIGGKIYYLSKELPQAERETFTVLPAIAPEEKRKIWKEGGPKDILQELAVDDYSACDKNHVFRGDWMAKRLKNGKADLHPKKESWLGKMFKRD